MLRLEELLSMKKLLSDCGNYNMDEYKIIISELAFDDMASIKRYIRSELKNPEAAEKIIEDFYVQIRDLSLMPKRFELIDEEILSSFYGIRKVQVGNYYVFYRFFETTGIISIIRVLYKRRDWSQLL